MRNPRRQLGFWNQRRGDGSDWSAWSAGWQEQKGEGKGKGKGFDSAPGFGQVGETEASPGFGQVGEMDAAILFEEVKKRQQVVGSGTDPEALMKALGETVKLQQQLFHLLSESGATNAEAKASAESAALASAESATPQEPAEGEAAQIEVEVPANADGECEAVSRLNLRDLTGCLTCIRASGYQVVMEIDLLASTSTSSATLAVLELAARPGEVVGQAQSGGSSHAVSSPTGRRTVPRISHRSGVTSFLPCMTVCEASPPGPNSKRGTCTGRTSRRFRRRLTSLCGH